ncbi:MAG: hypothetical protein WA609_09855 [Terriglobales bacterium]
MKIICAVLLITTITSSALGQTKKTGNAKSKGQCSPAVTGDNNTIYFTYCGSDPEETKKVLRLLNAINQGEDVTNAKLDAILEILSKPVKIIKSGSIPVAVPKGGHPRTGINFKTDDPIDRGQFEVVCDRPCTPVFACNFIGPNAPLFATVSDDPNIAEFIFRRQFPALTECGVIVESRDDKAVTILDVKTSQRTTNLVPNAVQPIPNVSSTGITIQ